MNRSMHRSPLLAWLSVFALLGCSGGATEPPLDDGNGTGDETTVEVVQGDVPRESPPAAGPPRELEFPTISRATTSSGLETNTVRYGELPVVYLRLVIRTGYANDPADKRGLASMVVQMLKEGTRTRTSAQLAEAVEFLGANLSVGSDTENVYIVMSALAEHLDEVMELLADVARNPRFSETELRRLRTREIDRLSLSSQNPRYLARREMYRRLYGEHPYAHTDTTVEAIGNITRRDLSAWHRANVTPSNSFLVATGNVDVAAVQAAAERHFAGWRDRTAPGTSYTTPPARSVREVVIVDRPRSVQSVIYVGNLTLARNNPDFVPLTVANQVLGGSAASRLFMDLREQRSLTYGAYSSIAETAQPSPFIAYAAVRNEVTEEAMAGFMEHLDRIATETPPQPEILDAQNFLNGSFPLQIETAGRVATMVEQQRIFSLPDDYWGQYRTAIGAVTPAQAHEAAAEYIRPDRALIIAVGRAEAIAEPLRAYGPVLVVDNDGNEISRFPAASAE